MRHSILLALTLLMGASGALAQDCSPLAGAAARTLQVRDDLLVRSQAAVASSVTVARGTESSGGGGVVVLEGGPVLLDHFTLLDDAAKLLPDPRPKSTIPCAGTLPFVVGDGMSSDVAFDEAQAILRDWANLPNDVMSYSVARAMQSPLHWSFTDHPLEAPAMYLAPSLPKGKVEVAAFYHYSRETGGQVWLQRLIWNQLLLRDQVGLVLHETLRQVQLGYKNGYDDEALQRATAIYLTCRPVGRLNYYMFYVLNNSPEMADRIYGDFASFVKKECRPK